MTISKLLIVMLCAGSGLLGVVTTLTLQGSSECISTDQRSTDAAFKDQPTIRGGSKGY